MASKVKLTEIQETVLRLAVTSGTRITFYSERDATLNALRRKGFAEFISGIGQTYARSHWWITDDGMVVGALLASS